MLVLLERWMSRATFIFFCFFWRKKQLTVPNSFTVCWALSPESNLPSQIVWQAILDISKS